MTLDNNRSPISSLAALLILGFGLLGAGLVIRVVQCAPVPAQLDGGLWPDSGAMDPCDARLLLSPEERRGMCVRQAAP